MNTIKSITQVRLQGEGNNGNWGVRIRLTDGTELFGGVGSGYTLHQACAMSSNCGERVGTGLQNPVMNNSMLGIPDARIFNSLPAGIRANAK